MKFCWQSALCVCVCVSALVLKIIWRHARPSDAAASSFCYLIREKQGGIYNVEKETLYVLGLFEINIMRLWADKQKEQRAQEMPADKFNFHFVFTYNSQSPPRSASLTL